MPLKKNDIIKLNITAVASDGSGIGRTDENQVVFVPQSAVGDTLEIRILKVQKNLAYGKIENILSASENRVTPDCPVFKKCGGCVYRHIDYGTELEIKRQKVSDALSRIGGIDSNLVKPIVGAENIDRYRNKAQIPISRDKLFKVHMGFYAKHSHRIVDCDDCLLSPKIFTDITKTVKEFLSLFPELAYDEETHTGKIRHLYLRYGEKSKEVMVCFVVNSDSFAHQDELANTIIQKHPQVSSIVINTNTEKTNVILGKKNKTLFGKGYITDELCGLNFEISPLSFYQVNRSQTEKLYNIARKYAGLRKDEVLMDLYCGTGTIGLSMAKDAKSVIGVEVIPQAVSNAQKNAETNNIKNADFICVDAAKAVLELEESGIIPDVVIVDPPRKGLEKSLIYTVARMAPKRVVYVSCDPATLARDLKIFCENGYCVREATPVDLFPRTCHVETVVLMSRVKN